MTNVLTALFDTLNLICYTFTFLTRESMFTERVRTATAFLFTLHYILRNAERWQQMLSTVIVSWNWKIKLYIDIYILWVVARVLLWGCLLAEDSPVNCSEGSFGSCFRPVRFWLSSHVDICTQTEEIHLIMRLRVMSFLTAHWGSFNPDWGKEIHTSFHPTSFRITLWILKHCDLEENNVRCSRNDLEPWDINASIFLVFLSKLL